MYTIDNSHCLINILYCKKNNFFKEYDSKIFSFFLIKKN